MKYLFSFVLLFLMLCSCKSDKIVLLVGGVKKVFDRFDPNAPPPKLPPPPDKPLKEIRFFGSHAVGWHGYPSGDFVFQWKAYCYKEEEEKNKGFPYIKKRVLFMIMVIVIRKMSLLLMIHFSKQGFIQKKINS